MNTTSKLVLSLFLFVMLSGCKKHPAIDLAHVSLIPQPVSVAASDGVFELTAATSIYVDASPELLLIGQYLADRLKPATGFALNVVSAKAEPEEGIVLMIAPDKELGDEGYQLSIDEKRIEIKANAPVGLFRAIQTLRQTLPASIELQTVQKDRWEIATGVIRDHPRYKWRGAMLDVARHFFSVEDVKRYIDLLTAYKINILHLHLSDDQGWRIEIKSWPELTKIGGLTEVGGGKGGFYTQAQYTEIIRYAQRRFIIVVPEIDLPGHINSALASYGELNGGTIVPAEGRVKPVVRTSPAELGRKTKSKPTELYSGIEVGWSTLRVEKPATFKFVEDVLRELSDLTPGPYIHIGGDEAAATKKEDYIVFINRFTQLVKARNKIMVGWEEIAQGNINEDVVTQYWHSSKYALMAAEKGSKIIMSPSKKTYLDMKYDTAQKLGLHWANYIEVDTAYRWDPATIVIGLPEQNIAGIEAPLWSETVTNISEIEYMLFPRLPGYAEIGWSSRDGRSWDEYKVRLGKHSSRFSAMKINYFKSKRVPWAD